MFSCQRCGQCCNKFAISVGYNDFMRWIEQKRYDIISELTWHISDKLGVGLYFGSTLVTKNGKAICPFYNNGCMIHDTKPMVCVDSPIKDDKFSFCPQYSNIECDYKIINENEYKEFVKLIEHKEEIDKLIEFSRMKIIESNFT